MPPTQPPYPTLASQTGGRSLNLTNSTPMVSLIFGVIGLLFFAPLGIAAIWLGVRQLRRPEVLGTPRVMAVGGIVTGIIGLVWGGIQLAILIFAIASGAEYST